MAPVEGAIRRANEDEVGDAAYDGAAAAEGAAAAAAVGAAA
jgi:hypothetical protein